MAIDYSRSLPNEYGFSDIDELVDALNKHLGKEGYVFEISNTQGLQGGFQRVNVGRLGTPGVGSYSLYLDLRVGLMSSRGRTIEMAGSSPGTYAMPGFARHVAGASEVSPTLDTFKDYIRSIYEYSARESKTPNQVKWQIYQKGYTGRQLPGSEQWGVEEFEQSLYPKAGGVLGRSSSTGKRSFMAQTVRYYIPEEEDPNAYFKETLRAIGTGMAPLGLTGYVPESSKWKAWVPAGTRDVIEMYPPGSVRGQKQQYVFLPRTIEGSAKSSTIVHESRELSDVPLYRDPITKRLMKITPTEAAQTTPGGLRKGWTRSSMVLPGETEGRVVFSKQMAFVDQPDMPGSAVVGKGAYSYFDEGLGKTIETEAIGESGEMQYEFGVRTTAEFEELLKHRLKIGGQEGVEIPTGRGMFEVGRYWKTDKEYQTEYLAYTTAKEAKTAARKKYLEELQAYKDAVQAGLQPTKPSDSWKYMVVPKKPSKFEPLLVNKAGYPMRMGRATIHVPQYFIPGTEGEAFSNLPQYYIQGGKRKLATTDRLVNALRKKYGDALDVVQYSSIGTGTKMEPGKEDEDPAAIYMTYEIERLTPTSIKTGGIKAGEAPVGYELFLKYFGVKNKQGRNISVDFITQEGKVPARILMSSFGIMDMNTQLDFVSTFLPQKGKKQQAAVEIIKKYITDAYSKQGGPRIFAEEMATIWGDVTGAPMSGDMLFQMMFRNVLAVAKPGNEKAAASIRSKYGIGLLEEQEAMGRVYSAGEKRRLESILAELGPEASGLIRFEPFMLGDDGMAIKVTEEMLKANKKGLMYQMYYKIPGARMEEGKYYAQGVAMQVGMSHVPEYPSQSGFINSKAIMSLIENYPKISYEMGLRNKLGSWGGVYSQWAYSSGVPEPIVPTAQAMYAYLGFQGDLQSGEVAIPGDVVTINESLANKLKDIVEHVKKLPNTSDQVKLRTLRDALHKIQPMMFDIAAGTELDNSWLLDPKSMTLVPPMRDVLGAEHFAPGVVKGRTETHIGDMFVNLLEAAVNSAQADVGAQMNLVGTARNRFYNKINEMYYPGGKRSKQMFRHITGMVLPGTRGGRYQGMTELESGNAFASDDYIRRMLSSQGFMGKTDITRIMKWLDTNPDAYLPILSQRFPDVSAITTWMPLKLRSAKHLQTFTNTPLPSGHAAADLFFMSTSVNRFQVGDFDADPAMQKVVEMTELKGDKGQKTGMWAMTKGAAEEFQTKFDLFYGDDQSVAYHLEQMFGKAGIAVTGRDFEERLAKAGESWDVSRKNLADYVKGYYKGSSMLTRSKEAGFYSALDTLNAFKLGSQFQAGKGVSYITRSELMDLPALVLGMKGRDKDIFSKAYERFALSYNSYLDLKKIMAGGFTALETMMNTYGVKSVEKDINTGVTQFHTSYMITKQGHPEGVEEEISRDKWFMAGSKTTPGIGIIAQLIAETARMDSEFMSNEMLAWGWSEPGKGKKVLQYLQNPERYWSERYDTKDWTREQLTNRADMLVKMAEQGEGVGFNSPYYLALTWKSIERLQRKQPEAIYNRDVQIPWINGKMMAVEDIIQTPEYRKFSVAENLFVRGSAAPSVQDLELLKGSGSFRLAGMAEGIWASIFRTTQGQIPIDIAEREWKQRVEEVNRRYAMQRLKETPIIHASELGAMMQVPLEYKKDEWKAPSREEKGEAIQSVVLRALGYPLMMSGREPKSGIFWSRKGDEAAGEAITGGIAYEESYRRRHPEEAHIGALKPSEAEDYNIRYTLGNVEVHGIPDFVSYENGKFVIRDTKSPAPIEGTEYTSEWARATARKYRYRIQQIAYAYGIEKWARPLDQGGLTKERWRDIMLKWGVTDEDKIINMRAAAARGDFKLLIQPGRVDRRLQKLGIGPDFDPIEVPYGPAQKAELANLVESITKMHFTPGPQGESTVGEIAAETYGLLKRPISERALPSRLSARWWERTDVPASMRLFAGLRQVAAGLGYNVKAAGGGRFSNISGQRIRVGEGGPEEIIIGPHGVSIVPTSELTESRVARGEFEHIEGYLGKRAMGGEDIIIDNPELFENAPKYVREAWELRKRYLAQAEEETVKAGTFKEEGGRKRYEVATARARSFEQRAAKQLEITQRWARKQPSIIEKIGQALQPTIAGPGVSPENVQPEANPVIEPAGTPAEVPASLQPQTGGAQPPNTPTNPPTTTATAPTPKRRGRPKKVAVVAQPVQEDDEDQNIIAKPPSRFNEAAPGQAPAPPGMAVSEYTEAEPEEADALTLKQQEELEYSQGGISAKVFQKTMTHAVKQIIQATGGKFPRAVPKDEITWRTQMRKNIQRFDTLERLGGKFTGQMMRALGEVAERSGLTTEMTEITERGGGVADVLNLFARKDVSQESIMSAIASHPQISKTAAKVVQMDTAYQAAVRGIEMKGDIGRAKAAFISGGGDPEVWQALERFQAKREKSPVMEQAVAAAQEVRDLSTGVKTYEKTMMGIVKNVDPNLVADYEKSLRAAADANYKHEKATASGVKDEEGLQTSIKKRLEAELKYAQVIEKGEKIKAGDIFKEGERFRGFEVMKRAGREVTEEELPQIEKAFAAEKKRQAAEQRLQRFEKTGEVPDDLGFGVTPKGLAHLGRSLMGGFGLMYMQSIGRIITGKAMEGYAEAQQSEMLAQQQLGAIVGGFAPYQGVEARISRAQRISGGLGGYAIRGAYANILEDPTKGFLLGLGQAGVGAAGFGMFAASSLGLSSGAIAATGGIAAALAIPAVLGLGIGGAISQPQATAASLYAQQQMGKAGQLSWATLGRWVEGGGGDIQKALNTINQMAEAQRQKPGIGFQQISADLGWTRDKYETAVKAYSEAIAKSFTEEPQYTYQAIRLQQMYQAPLTSEVGGGLQNLAAMLQQGIPVQQLAQAQAWTPYATGRQQLLSAGQFMAQMQGGQWTEARNQYMLQGASFLQSLGIMAPIKTGEVPVTTPAHTEMVPTVVGYQGGTDQYGEYTRTPIIEEVATTVPAKTKMESAQAAYEAELGENLSYAQQSLIQEMVGVQLARRRRGEEYTSAETIIGQVQAMTPEQMDLQTRITRFDQLMSNMLDKLTDTFNQLGVILPDMTEFAKMTYGQQAVAQQGGQYGLGLSLQMIQGGMAPLQAQQAGLTFANIAAQAPQLMPQYQGLFSMDRNRWADYLRNNPQIAQQLFTGGGGGRPYTLPGMGGAQIPMTNFAYVGMENGVMTGLQWGRTSLEGAGMTAFQGALSVWGTPQGTSVFGQNAQAIQGVPGMGGTGFNIQGQPMPTQAQAEAYWQSQGYDVSLINLLQEYGTRGYEIRQQRLGFEQARASAGLQMEQIQLQKWYMPQQFALQAQGRQLGYEQTEWGLQQQAQQLALSQQNFAFQTGMQQRQMGLQRGWQQEDWRYAAQVRGMQWQWQQEDFAENVRFMTGRERRLAERQMGRATTMHDLESEQIEKQKSRQKELWAMEDERFNQQVAYQESLFKMQEENLAKQNEFYQRNKALQEEQAALQEEYWRRSIALQEKGVGIQAYYNELQSQAFETMVPLNAKQEDVNGQFQIMNEKSLGPLFDILKEVDPIFASYVASNAVLKDDIATMAEPFSTFVSSYGTFVDDTTVINETYKTFIPLFGTFVEQVQELQNILSPRRDNRRQHGGRVYPGEAYLVGEVGMELFQPDTAGTIKPLDPWGTTFTATPTAPQGKQGPIHLTIYLGDERLMDRVLDAVDQAVKE